jgi:hypothetical protein
MRDDSEVIYGWCGLCHCFSQFPHDCPGRDFLAQDNGVDDVDISSTVGLSEPYLTGVGRSR